MESNVKGKKPGDIPAWAGWYFIVMGTVPLLIGSVSDSAR